MAFGSTPTFELFKRGTATQVIKRFRGLNVYQLVTTLGPEWALDLNNVIVGGNGGLAKMRLPVSITPASGFGAGPDSFWDFQQQNGTRQLVATFGQTVSYYDGFANNAYVTYHTIETSAQNIGPWSAVTAGNRLWMANGQRMRMWTGSDPRVDGTGTPVSPWQNWGFPVPQSACTTQIIGQGPAPGGPSPTFGWQYSCAIKDSVTGHISVRTPATASVIPGGGNMTKVVPPVADPIFQDQKGDILLFYRTLDGGGLHFLLCQVDLKTAIANPVATLNGVQVPTILVVQQTAAGGGFPYPNFYIDDSLTADASLDQSQQASLINNPPLVGQYVATGQQRIAVMGLVGAPQDIIYSGLEQVLVGDPLQSFLPGNRLRLSSSGADTIAGGGFLQVGLVAMSHTGKLFMARGTLQDIVTTAPVNFTSYLEELPWNLGLMSHLSIAVGYYGMMWLAGDKTVQLFSGSSMPQDVSGPIYPILRSITRGQESKSIGAMYNWLDRDWYVLSVCLNGAVSPSKLLFWALHIESQEIDIFMSDIPAGFTGVINTPDLQRVFAIAQGGFVQSIPVQFDTTGGIGDPALTPATNANLSAFWRSGYFGNETPYRSKMWRHNKITTDQDPSEFSQTLYLVNDADATIKNPKIIGPTRWAKGQTKLGVNQRANRMSVLINFPAKDVSANVLELYPMSIPTSDR